MSFRILFAGAAVVVAIAALAPRPLDASAAVGRVDPNAASIRAIEFTSAGVGRGDGDVTADSSPALEAECGAEGQRPCTITDRPLGPSCDDNLIEDFSQNKCVHPDCGRQNDRACPFWERLKSCDTGYTEIKGCSGDDCNGSLGTCVQTPGCGGAGQRACLNFLFDRCNEGYTEVPGCSGDCLTSNPLTPVSQSMCTKVGGPFVEPTTNATPDNVDGTGAVYGYADLHMHLLAHLAHGGGVLAGKPYEYDWTTGIESGFMKALRPDYGTDLKLVTGKDVSTGTPACPSYLSTCGSRVFHKDHGITGDGVGSWIGTNDNARSNFGAPLFSAWPKWTSTTHQQVYYKWLERAWQGGLRLISQLAVSNEALCRGGPRIDGKDCFNSMESIDEQLEEIYRFEDFIDRQYGKDDETNHDQEDLGWFRIVTTPKQAREVIAAGKMAVVLGIEVDNLFGAKFAKEDCLREGEKKDFLLSCGFDISGDTEIRTLAFIKQEIDRYYEKGVRHIFPIHNFDNGYGGPATWQDAIEVGNRVSEGHWWWTDDCPADESGQKYGFGLTDFTQAMLALVKFYFTGIISEYPDREDVPPPSCNHFGLFPQGQWAIEYMFTKGMIVDVDHMSRNALDKTIDKALSMGKPVVASHVLSFDNYDEAQRHERMRTKKQLERIAETGGMIAAMLKDDNLDQAAAPFGERGVKHTQPYGDVADDCRHSSKTFAHAYQYAVDVMGGPVAFGSDFNGVAGHFGPRFGSDACGGVFGDFNSASILDRSAQYRFSQPLSYPFELPGFGSFDRQKTGEKTFDYNFDGMAHVGLLPDFVKDLAVVGLPSSDMNMIFRSAEAFIRVWEKAEGIDSATNGPQGLSIGSIDVWPQPSYEDAAIQFSLNDISPATGTSLVWNFGDGSSADQSPITHTFENQGVYTVTVTATDSVFGTTAKATRQITIHDGNDTFLGPEISILAPDTAPEGSTVKVNFQRSFAWENDSVSCGQGQLVRKPAINNLFVNRYDFDCFFPGGIAGTQQIVVSVHGYLDVANVESQSRTIQLVNAAPGISTPSSSFVVPFTGSPVTFTVPIDLVDSAGDKLSLSVIWSDGQNRLTAGLDPGRYEISRTFEEANGDGRFSTVTLLVRDEVAATKTVLTVDVIAPPPAVLLTGPSLARVGDVATYTAQGDAPGVDLLSWSCGPFAEPVGSPAPFVVGGGITAYHVQCRFPVAGPSHVVSVTMARATDGRIGGAGTTTRVGTPPGSLLDGPPTVPEGSTPTYHVQGMATESDVVTLGPIACGTAGAAFQTPNQVSPPNLHVFFTCRFSDGPATVPITVAVSDLDGETFSSIDVTVANVRPSITALGPPTGLVKRDVAASISIEASEPGDDALTATISWGDGSSSTVGVPRTSGASHATSVSHAWATAGLKTIGVSLTDGESNPVTASLQVQVGDTVPPVVTVPSPITKEATAANGATVSFSATAQDNLEGAKTPACTPASGSTFPLGSTTVTCTASDSDGNEGSASFAVTVVDTTAPSISVIVASNPILALSNHVMIPVSFRPTVSDAVDAAPVCSITAVASNEPINGTGDGDTAPDWEITGPLSANLRAERAGNGGGRIYTLSVRCTDSARNATTGQTTVTVPHSKKK